MTDTFIDRVKNKTVNFTPVSNHVSIKRCKNGWHDQVGIGSGFQKVSGDAGWKLQGIEKNVKKWLTMSVIFGVTVANFEIDYLDS